MHRGRWAAALAIAAAVAVAAPAVAIAPIGPNRATAVAEGRALSRSHPVLRFSGQMHNPTPLPAVSNPDPTVCAANCQLWSLKVATRAPFLVSLHNATQSIDDGFDLSVYDPGGNQVGSANGIGSNGQALVVEHPSPGTFTIAVTVTYAYDAVAGYLGEARLMTRPSWHLPSCRSRRPCPILPALRVDPPSDVHIDGIPPVASTPLGFPFPVNAPTKNSCYADESAGTGATRCLRFTSEVDNVGLGLLTLQVPWATRSSSGAQVGFVPGECQAQQVVRYTDGSTRRRSAGPCEFHAEHGHFHYTDFVEFSLHAVNRDGSTGTTIAHSLKESFCLADDGYFGFGTPGPNGARDYVGQPDCNVPSLPTAASPDAWITMGLTPGWGDIYTWDTPDQYIDISNTPPGTYDIVSQANPAGLLDVAGVRRPCATTRVRLTATGVSVVDPDVPCRAR